MFDSDWLMPVVVVGLVSLMLLMGIVLYHEQQEWDAFAIAHHCTIVGKTRGDVVTSVAPIIGGNGGVAVGTSYIPGKTGYACDDGVTYWR